MPTWIGQESEMDQLELKGVGATLAISEEQAVTAFDPNQVPELVLGIKRDLDQNIDRLFNKYD